MPDDTKHTAGSDCSSTPCSACKGSGMGPPMYRCEIDKTQRDQCRKCWGTGIKLRDSRQRDDGWKPIETAPKNGTIFMAYVPHGAGGFRFLGYWNRHGRLVCTGGRDDYTAEATLWTDVRGLPNQKGHRPDEL